MPDSEIIQDDDEEKTKKSSSPPDDLSSLMGDLCEKVPWKIAIMLFLILLIINSDVFIEHTLKYIPGTSIAGQPTSFGTILQALIVILIFILISIFSAADDKQ